MSSQILIPYSGSGHRCGNIGVKALRPIALFLRQAADVSAVFLISQDASQIILVPSRHFGTDDLISERSFFSETTHGARAATCLQLEMHPKLKDEMEAFEQALRVVDEKQSPK